MRRRRACSSSAQPPAAAEASWGARASPPSTRNAAMEAFDFKRPNSILTRKARAHREPGRAALRHISAGATVYSGDRRGSRQRAAPRRRAAAVAAPGKAAKKSVAAHCRSEEHTSELQSLMRISYAVFCLKKKKQQ